MNKWSNTEAELKKRIAYKTACIKKRVFLKAIIKRGH